jgi:hypothetical protein
MTWKEMTLAYFEKVVKNLELCRIGNFKLRHMIILRGWSRRFFQDTQNATIRTILSNRRENCFSLA